MFFDYSQNNSGGSFDFNEADGITHIVIIEADSYRIANAKVQDIGMYFDGVDRGIDCPCCGDRWYESFDNADGQETPTIYGKTPKEWVKNKAYLFMEKGKEICVHYADGRKEWF